MNDYGYGLWVLVVIDTAVILLFAASFFHPKTKRDWRAFGSFSAFVVALFVEMYGAPLTVYLLSGWLGSTVLGLDLTHDGGTSGRSSSAGPATRTSARSTSPATPSSSAASS